MSLALVAGVAWLTAAPSPARAGAPDPPWVIDAHNDVLQRVLDKGHDFVDSPPWLGQTDLPRLRAGGVGGQVFSVWVDPRLYPGAAGPPRAMALIGAMNDQAARHPADLALCRTADDVRRARAAGRFAALMGLEGCAPLMDDPANIAKFHDAGIAVMTLTWRGDLSWAGASQPIRAWGRRPGRPGRSGRDFRRPSAATDTTTATTIAAADTDTPDDPPPGLNDLGRRMVREMNRVGVVVDLSHVSDRTFYDALAVTDRPVMVSHSNARALAPHPRNLTDDMLRALAANGGVVGVNFYRDFLAGENTPDRRADLDTVLDHIDHIARVAGWRHVGLGTDWDGMESPARGLESGERMADLMTGLTRRGYTDEQRQAIGSGNWVRVIQAAQSPPRSPGSGTPAGEGLD